MQEKTYLTPGKSEPEIILVPPGLKDAQGNKIPTKTIKFKPNAVGVGQFTTSDPELQKILQNHEWFACGRIVEMNPKDVSQKTYLSDEEKMKPKVVRGVATAGPEPSEPVAPVNEPEKGKPTKVKSE